MPVKYFLNEQQQQQMHEWHLIGSITVVKSFILLLTSNSEKNFVRNMFMFFIKERFWHHWSYFSDFKITVFNKRTATLNPKAHSGLTHPASCCVSLNSPCPVFLSLNWKKEISLPNSQILWRFKWDNAQEIPLEAVKHHINIRKSCLYTHRALELWEDKCCGCFLPGS